MRNSRQKKKQTTMFADDKQTPVPTISNKRRVSVEQSAQPEFLKRSKTQHNNDLTYLTYFNDSMRNYISTVILNKIKNSKKLEADLLKAKNDLLSKTRLPNGIMTNAANLAGLEAPIMRNFMDNNIPKLPINLWKDYVNEHYDSIAEGFKKRNLSVKKKEPSTSSNQSGSSSTLVEEQYRTFSISMKKALRKDLPENIENIIKTKLETSLKNSSDFSAHFLFIVNATSIILKNTAFVKRGTKFVVEKSAGFDVLQVLPSGFVQKNDLQPVFSAMPLPRDLSDEFGKELEVLFTDQHLSLIKSFFFGSGVQQKNLEKHPLEEFLFNLLVSNGINKGFYNTSLTSEEIAVALTHILTSIKNMWRTNDIFRKLLDHLLDVLLKLHLAGIRTGEYKSYVDQKIKNKSKAVDQSFFSSNRRRNLISTEYKKQKKLGQKIENTNDKERLSKYKDQILKSDQRIIFFRKLKTHKIASPSTHKSIHDDEAEAENEELNLNTATVNEPSRSRLRALRSVTKHFLLYSDSPVTVEDIRREVSDATDKELATINHIIQMLKPYIPDKKRRFIIGYQMPFCLLANDILQVTGYTKFTRLLFPKPHPSKLQTLEINAASLYQMLTSGPNPLNIADFESHKIDSIEYARSNKDAVFCSIFDLSQLNESCQSYGLSFAQNIRITPGIQACKILGSKKVKKTGGGSIENPIDHFSRVLNHPTVLNESKKSPSDLQREIDFFDSEVKDTMNNLRNLLKENQVTKLTIEINKIKAELTKERKDDMIRKLKDFKKKRNEAYYLIQQCQKKKATLNQELYFKRVALRHHSKINQKMKDKPANVIDSEKEDRKYYLTDTTRGVYSATECRLVKSPEKFIFSGTDNGIINLSTTTPFTLDRYKFHINLYNHYQLLQDTDVTITDEDKQYLDLPKQTQKINSVDIDVGCSHMKVRRKLERFKRTDEGKNIRKIEEDLYKASISTNNVSIANYQKSFKLHTNKSDSLQKFYSSKKRARILRAKEIQVQRFLNKLVDNERRQIVSGGDWTKVVQFVGDRGTGVGSTIKRHRRYGGKWLEEMRGKRGNVCITNEYMTSQTCIFCFEHLEHPLSIEEKNGDLKKKITKGSLLCVNSSCISVKTGRATKSRDALSSLAIGLSGLTSCILGMSLPHSSPKKISQYETEEFKKRAFSFSKEEKKR